MVKLRVARLVTADQQDRRLSRIERKERPQRPAANLRAELLHVRVPRPLDGIDVGSAEAGTELFEQQNAPVDRILCASVRDSNHSPNSSVYSMLQTRAI